MLSPSRDGDGRRVVLISRPARPAEPNTRTSTATSHPLQSAAALHSVEPALAPRPTVPPGAQTELTQQPQPHPAPRADPTPRKLRRATQRTRSGSADPKPLLSRAQSVTARKGQTLVPVQARQSSVSRRLSDATEARVHSVLSSLLSERAPKRRPQSAWVRRPAAAARTVPPRALSEPSTPAAASERIPQRRRGLSHGPHHVKLHVPKFLVAGPELSAEVTRGTVTVWSGATSLNGLRTRSTRHATDLQFRAGKRYEVTDPTLWEAAAAALPQLSGSEAEAYYQHHGGLPVHGSGAIAFAKHGGIHIREDQTRAQEFTLFGSHHSTTGFRLIATTRIRLPDGSVVYETLDITVRLIPVSKLPPRLRREVERRHLKEGETTRIDPTPNRRGAGASGLGYAKLAAADVARAFDGADVENPGDVEQPHDEGEVVEDTDPNLPPEFPH